MRLTFLGAAGTVTGSKTLLEHEERFGFPCTVPEHRDSVEL